jgi:hypothetical protein
MIKMLTAYTGEFDDAEAAAAEILGHLKLEDNQLRNSVGILSFHTKFLASGVLRAISDALPFDAIGGMTSNTAVSGTADSTALSLAVLTSDDVSFSAGVSAPISGGAQEAAKGLCSSLIAKLPEKPSLLYAVLPLYQGFCGDEIVSAIDEVSGETPLFGLGAFSYAFGLDGPPTFFNGKEYADSIVMAAMSGPVNPRFFATTIRTSQTLWQKAIVTEARASVIRKVNGVPVLEYLKSIGLTQDGKLEHPFPFPLLLTLSDGSQVARASIGTTEEGYVACYGAVPTGAGITLAEVGRDHVLDSAGEFADRLLRTFPPGEGARNALIVSCAGRQWPLALEFDAEIQIVRKILGDSVQYQFSYVNGEICPTLRTDGTEVNRFHNYTMIACTFQ